MAHQGVVAHGVIDPIHRWSCVGTSSGSRPSRTSNASYVSAMHPNRRCVMTVEVHHAHYNPAGR